MDGATRMGAFRDVILRPRELSYKVMFSGPTGTDVYDDLWAFFWPVVTSAR